MPNHVLNILRLYGAPDAIRRMQEAVQNPEHGIGSISFDRILPMPKELEIECGSRTEEGLRLYRKFLSEVPTDSLTVPPEQEQAYLTEHPDINREVWELGRSAWNNLQTYGASGWYDWRCEHWGTKWDAYGFDEALPLEHPDGIIAFQTAWDAPHPVMEALAERYPNLTMEHEWADEDIGYNCGMRVYRNGECDEEFEPSEGIEAIRYSTGVWGEEPEDYGFRLNKTSTAYIHLDGDNYERIHICGQPALFTNDRLSEDEIPAGMYLYHLRQDDDGDRFAALEPTVTVNHGGSVITLDPIDFGGADCIPLTDVTGPDFFGIDATLDDFLSHPEPDSGMCQRPWG